MVKVTLLAGLVWLGAVAPQAPIAAKPDAGACIPADQCCRVCDDGQACGKTCISRSKTCHVGHGCACNASEVCGS